MNTWDLLLRRDMLGKVGPKNPKTPGQVNPSQENFSSPLVQAIKQMSPQSKISKGAKMLGGPQLPGLIPKSR